MRIGELADRAGVTTKTIRYYERIGLLPEAPRTPSGYRQYGADAVDRIAFIKDSQAAGLRLAEVASVLELKEAGQRSCEHTTALVERHLREIDEQLERLQATRHALAALADRAAGLDPGACTDPNRCQVIIDTT